MKKISAVLLACVMMLYGICPVLAATEKTSYKLNFAFDMGILTEDNNGDRLLEDEVTRIQALIAVYRLMHYSDIDQIPAATKQYYSDIGLFHYGAGYAQAMTEDGFVNGYDDGTYGADTPITLNEWITILLRTAGYSEYFQLVHKTPYETAQDLGLLKSVDAGINDKVTRRNAAMMIYNLMFIKTLKIVGGKGTTVTYDAGDEYIREVLGLEYVEGIVDGIGGAALTEDISDGYASVDGKMCSFDNKKEEQYLGYQARMIYNADTGRALSIIPDDRNKAVTLDAEDLEKYEDNTYFYYKSKTSSQTARYVLDRTFDAVYNRRSVFDSRYMMPEYGTVTLVDNNHDDRYDVVIINDFESFMVEAYSENDRFITMKNRDENGKNIRIDLSAYDVCEAENEAGERAEASAIIVPGSVVTIQRSADEKSIYISVSREVMKETIESITADGETKKYSIGGNLYEAVPNCYIPDGADTPGSKADIYLDKNGRIAAIMKSEDAEGWKYGYIKKVWVEDAEERAVLRIFNENESLGDILCETKVVLDGEKLTKPQIIADRINEAYDNFEDKKISGYTSEIHTKRIIRYCINRKGFITKIDTPIEHSLYDLSVPEGYSSDNCLMLRAKGYIYWKNGMKMFKTVMKAHMDIQGDIIGGDDMKIFMLPNDTGHENDWEYSVKTLAQSTFSEAYYYASGYNTSVESMECTVTAIRNRPGNATKKMMVVDNFGEMIDSSGEVVKAISGYLGTSYRHLPVQESSFDVDSLKRGDVIFYDYVNEKMLINGVGYSSDKEGLLDQDDSYHPDDGGIHFNIPYRVLKAKVTRVSGTRMQVTPASQATEVMPLPSAVVIYDSEKGDVSVGTIYDVRTEEIYGSAADTVFISTRSGNIDEMIAVR